MILNEGTKRQLRMMNQEEYISAFELTEKDPTTIGMPFVTRFERMVDSAYQQKYNGRVQKLEKGAKLKFPHADVHDIVYAENRPIDRNVITDLASGRYIDDCCSIVLRGYASSGKTFLACALAREACRQLHSAYYIRMPDLLSLNAEKLQLTGSNEKLLRKFARYRVLVIDEWLIYELSKVDLNFMFELTERRYDCTSTIFCTLFRWEDWLKRLGGGGQAESIVERFRYTSTTVETGDVNMRQIFHPKEN